jgi:hypothetical protein
MISPSFSGHIKEEKSSLISLFLLQFFITFSEMVPTLKKSQNTQSPFIIDSVLNEK